MSGDQVTRGGYRDWIGIFVMLSSAPTLGLMFTAMSPALLLIARQFGAAGPPIAIPALGIEIDSSLFAQLVSTLPSAGLMIGSAPAGWAIDRWGARVVLVWSLVAFAIFGSAGAYIENAVLLLASRFALGFAAIGCGAATIWMIGTRFDDRQRAWTLSARNILAGVSGYLSSIAAGHAAAAYGWHAVFGLYLAPLLIIPLALFALQPAPAVRSGPRSVVPMPPLGRLWLVFMLILALAVVMMMNVTQLPFLLKENGITDPKALGGLAAVGSAMGMAGSLVYALIGPRLSLRWNYSLIALTLGAGVAIIGLSHELVMAEIGAWTAGFSAGLLVPHFIRLVLNMAPPAARGRAVGLAFAFLYFGDLLNPLVVHPLAMAIGIHQAFQLLGAAVAVTALQILVPLRLIRARPYAAP
jgi:MFS family permease